MITVFKTKVYLTAINQHLKRLFDDNKIDLATIKQYLIVQKERKREVKRNIKMYSLEAIIAVGYRVNSDKGREFLKRPTAS